jgi:hypothetical protein
MENVELGAIGIIVIHNPADTEQEADIRAGDQLIEQARPISA